GRSASLAELKVIVWSSGPSCSETERSPPKPHVMLFIFCLTVSLPSASSQTRRIPSSAASQYPAALNSLRAPAGNLVQSNFTVKPDPHFLFVCSAFLASAASCSGWICFSLVAATAATSSLQRKSWNLVGSPASIWLWLWM